MTLGFVFLARHLCYAHRWRTDCGIALQACLTATTVNPVQMVKNLALHQVFDQLKRERDAPPLIDPHWFSIALIIKFKSLTAANQVASVSAHGYL